MEDVFPMEKEIKKTLAACDITIKDLLILSISCGIDSMSMLDFFVRQHYTIEIVHYNHQKREQSIDEAALVKQYCDLNDIPYHYYTIDVEEGNFHHQAHILRQQYLFDVAKISHASYILTAHHLDDLLESILIKLTRGSNILGYAGMQPCYKDTHVTWIKPMLYVSRDQINNYAKQHNVTYLNDESNDSDLYLRNRYRHAIVPIMKQENDNLLIQARQFHHQLTSAFRFIRKSSIAYLNHQLTIDIPSFLTLDDAVQDDVIAYLLESFQVQLSYEKFQTLKDIIKNKPPNKTNNIEQKHFFIKNLNKDKIKPLEPVKDILIEVTKGDTKLPNMAIFTFFDNSPVKTEEIQKLCYNKLAFPLWLRYRKDGDTLSYIYGHKKLKKLLIDEKVPMIKRNQLLVLTDNDGDILWVQDYYINETLGKAHTLYFTIKENDYAS